MFSSDRNIETISRLIESLLRYVKLQNEYVKLGVVEKVVRLTAALCMSAVVLLFVVIICIYLSFSAAYAMASAIGLPGAFLVMTAFYVVVLVLIYIFRRRLIVRPLLRIIADILLDR